MMNEGLNLRSIGVV